MYFNYPLSGYLAWNTRYCSVLQIVTTNPAEYQSVEEWRSQFVTSNFAKMGLRRPPYAFTRNGIGGNALCGGDMKETGTVIMID